MNVLNDNRAELLYKENRQAALNALAEIQRIICEERDSDYDWTPGHFTHGLEMAYIVEQLNDIVEFASS